MSELIIEICRESGICSLIKPGGRADLMPNEVTDIKDATGGAGQIRQIIAEADSKFAASLDDAELQRIAAELAG